MKLRNFFTKNGKIGGVVVRNSKGGETTLLNTHGKGAKYAAELRNNQRYTNNGKRKIDKNGEIKPLTREQKAYRSGWLDCNADHAKAYKWKNRYKSKNYQQNAPKRGRSNKEYYVYK